MIKTFRGLLKDQQQERIRLQTLDGKKGYRIKRIDLMSDKPGSTSYEHVVKVYSVKQTAIDPIVDFSEQTLLATAYLEGNHNENYTDKLNVVFDQVTFNQDIFITHYDVSTGESCNYYMELEVIKLDDVEATAVILKNFRNTNTV